MDSRYGEEVVVGVGGASGLARIDPGRPCGAGRRSAEEGDGGGSRRFSGKMERREWDGCAARKGGGECSLRVLALSGEGHRGVVVRMVEVAQTGTGRQVGSEGSERGRRPGGGGGQWPW